MPVADLVASLELEEVAPQRFRARNYEVGERGVVFGGQLAAQLVVAGSTVNPNMTVKSANAVFARPVMVVDDVELRVDVLQSGRTFASATASLWQYDKERARALVLLSSEEPDLMRHCAEMPDVAGPDDLQPWLGNNDLRIVGAVDIQDENLVGDPEMFAWVRYPQARQGEPTALGLLGHSSASFFVGTAMRPHAGLGQSAAHAEFSTGIISHTVSYHEPFDPREWMLLSFKSTYAGRGRAYGIGEAFDSSGQLLASYSQEAMLRHFPEGVSPVGQESTIL